MMRMNLVFSRLSLDLCSSLCLLILSVLLSGACSAQSSSVEIGTSAAIMALSPENFRIAPNFNHKIDGGSNFMQPYIGFFVSGTKKIGTNFSVTFKVQYFLENSYEIEKKAFFWNPFNYGYKSSDLLSAELGFEREIRSNLRLGLGISLLRPLKTEHVESYHNAASGEEYLYIAPANPKWVRLHYNAYCTYRINKINVSLSYLGTGININRYEERNRTLDFITAGLTLSAGYSLVSK